MHGGIAERSKGRRRRREKVSQKIPILYENFTKSNLSKSGKRLPKRNKQIMRKNKEEYLMGSETFVGAASSIHVQPAELPKQARGITRKTPRWQPRGDDTQSFRPLVQEERGVLRVRLLAPSTRVNTVQLCSACGS
jgi:hypothetical protein